MISSTMERSRQTRDSPTQRGAWWSILVIFFSFVAAVQAKQSLLTDREALERFMVVVDPNGELLPWVSGTNPCTWIGVDCYQNRVTSLRIQGLHLTGPLPANTLADLDQLLVLSLHHNRFSGTFPVDLARCTLLQRLFLGYNIFSGPLPDFTGMWPGMTHFSVGFNNFSGEIPASINAFKSLNLLDLQGNSFSGAIPTMSFEYLLKFSVANNNFVGPVPMSLTRFPASEFAGNAGLCGPPTETPCPQSLFASAMAPIAPVPSPQTPLFMDSGAPLLVTTPSPKNHTKLMSAGVTVVITVGVVVAAMLLIYVLCRPQGTEVLDKTHVGKPARDYSDASMGGVEFYSAGGPDHFKDSYAVSIAGEPEPERGKLVFFNKQNKEPFALEELLRASAETLGKSCVGNTYRADLGESVVLVVKRLKDVAAERKDFESHVETLGRLRHKNLVPLRAYYFSKDEKLLVSDYMPQGNLATLLHGDKDDDSRIHVDWITRQKIALGTARALAYLHKESVKLLHGNMKASNVLLSRDMEPFLSDYALTSLLSNANMSASRFVGYRAKEVTDIRKITQEADVYSFGVLLLEILTGQAPMQECNRWLDLPKWVMSVVRDKWTSEVFDVELMRYNNVEDEMVQMLQLALACVDSIPDRRPKMDEVVLLLEDITGDDSSFRRSDARSDDAAKHRTANYKSRACAPILVRPSSGVFVID
ncbi:hypothetical protein KC19_7G158000 [Ceratodon purpureus]|uniref:Protein kinase domain-containing protein n=1 Tax=Ceratodon purpureus TaxID=3225 RepID=A0A8T0H725_CERPU|nr:hypothetical protein KC19_7G158000 [Ceratodon purpureus]